MIRLSATTGNHYFHNCALLYISEGPLLVVLLHSPLIIAEQNIFMLFVYNPP